MQIHVLLFAAFREVLGSKHLDLEVPEGATVDDAFRALEHDENRLSGLRPYTTFAVNRQVVSADHRLESGDEVAFLQPVSGGSGD